MCIFQPKVLLRLILCLLLLPLAAKASSQKEWITSDTPLILAAVEASDEDDLIIEDSFGDSYNAASDTGSYLDEHFSSNLVASYAGFLGSANRQFYYLQTRYIEESKKLGLSGVLAVRAYNSKNKLELTRTRYSRTTGERIQQKVIFRSSKTQAELREGYLRLSRPFFDLYAGRRVLAFGQFDSFSPIDFVLPTDFGNSSLSFSKVDGKYPQTTLSAILYPMQNWELQFHHFPKIERDYLIVQNFQKATTVTNSLGEDATLAFKRPTDEAQNVVRLMYTGQKVIMGLTYYKGFDLIPDSSVYLKNKTFGGSNVDYFARTDVTYREMSAMGFEISYPSGNFNYKYELMVSKYYANLDTCYTGPDPDPSRQSQCVALVNHVKNNLNNKGFIQPTRQLHALGFDYNSENWLINFAVLGFIESVSADEEKANDLSRAAVDASEDLYSKKLLVIPTFHVARKYGADKKQTTGFGFGFLSSAVGASLYHNYKYSEDLSFISGLEFLSYRTDQAAETQLENESDGSFVEQKSQSALLRIGLAYQF